jgi:hypothetical protein
MFVGRSLDSWTVNARRPYFLTLPFEHRGHADVGRAISGRF